MKSILGCLLALTLVQAPSLSVAQGLVPVTVHTKIKTGMGKEEKFSVTSVRYCVFRSVRKAEDAKAKIEAAISQKSNSLDTEDTEAIIQQISKKLDIVWQISQPTGVFETNAIVGSGILILGENSLVVRKVEGKGEIEAIINGSFMLQEVNIDGKGGFIEITDVPPIDTGTSARFNINYKAAKGKTNERNRLIIQPIVIECQSEDTVAYLQPFVYEGEEYHKLQDKRFGYDYMKNDSVARGYRPEIVLRRDKEFAMNENVMFTKPDKDASYRCVYPIVLEDYHHVISRGGQENGSCNAIKPFKFLNLATGVAELKLSRDFREDAAARFDEHMQDVSLTFENNSDVLTDDSLNTVKLRELTAELRSYGDNLFQVTIQGGASAEGSVEHNTQLAKRRSDRALRLLRQSGMPSDVGSSTKPPKVSTWDDVLEAVEKQGNQEITDIVSNTIKSHKQNEVFGILKSMPFFNSVIEPILVSQRMMRCTYLVARERVMEPQEAVEEYYAHKQQYIARSKDIKPLSMGDYYNLFSMITDSLELDTLTTLAYSQMVEQPRYETLPIAPYLANRMAVMNLRRGTGDLSVLAPFINTTIKRLNFWQEIDQFHKRLINLKEILINQAMTYFLVENERSGMGNYILWKWLPQDDEQVRKVQMLSTFQTLYLQYLTGGLKDPAEIKRAQESEKYVLGADEENRAIIYTELMRFIGKTREDVEPLVDKMSDENAKKWYLKALLWVDDAGKEPVVGTSTGSQFKQLSFEEEMKMQREDPEKYQEYLAKMEEDSKKADDGINTDKIPYFLAFFQHSFDLEPSYKKLFYREGNISEEKRRTFKYRKKDIPAYRKKFLQIKAAEDALKKFDNLPDNSVNTDDNANNSNKQEGSKVDNQQEDNCND